MSRQIFISNRREESRWSSRSLYERLSAHFGQQQVFMGLHCFIPSPVADRGLQK